MKHDEVGCAVIHRKGRLLIAQRKPGTFLAGHWEFPGGKLEDGESIEECLVREVLEELGIQIRVGEFLRQSLHQYPEKQVNLHFYLCPWVAGEPQALDCSDFKWVLPEDLKNHQFPKGDEDMLNDLTVHQGRYFGK